MRRLTVHYRDNECRPSDEFTMGPYFPDEAKRIMSHLEKMGCYDFKLKPVKEAA